MEQDTNNTPRENEKDSQTTQPLNKMGLGMVFGISFGATLGGGLDNRAVGIALGVALGIVIGAVWSHFERKQ
jgi:hypothetical protein